MQSPDAARSSKLKAQSSNEAPDFKLQIPAKAAGTRPRGPWSLALFLSFELGTLSLVPAAEPWTDNRLAVTNQLELWFDASRQSAGRGSFQLPSLSAGN